MAFDFAQAERRLGGAAVPPRPFTLSEVEVHGPRLATRAIPIALDEAQVAGINVVESTVYVRQRHDWAQVVAELAVARPEGATWGETIA